MGGRDIAGESVGEHSKLEVFVPVKSAAAGKDARALQPEPARWVGQAAAVEEVRVA